MRKMREALLVIHFLILSLSVCNGFTGEGLRNRQRSFLKQRNVNRVPSFKSLSLSSSSSEEAPSENQFSVVIGQGSALNLDSDGTLTFSDSLSVEGSLSGRLECLCYNSENTLVRIGAEGELQADVKCVAMVEVLGTLIGNIHCQRLLVGPNARVIGDIITESLEICEGASLLGSISTGSYADRFMEADPEPIVSEDEYIQNHEPHPMASISVYHDIVQKAALKKGRAAGLGTPRNNKNNNRQPNVNVPRNDSNLANVNEMLDDFGNKVISLDKTKGKYVDSFGNPLIRGADDEQVASFREIRNLSSRTRSLLDMHRKEKEKELIRRKSTSSTMDEGDSSNNGFPSEEEGDEGDEGSMPSFLR